MLPQIEEVSDAAPKSMLPFESNLALNQEMQSHLFRSVEMDRLSRPDFSKQTCREVFKSGAIASLQSINADILECKAACTMDIAVGSEFEIRLVELVSRCTDLLCEYRKEAEDSDISADYFHDLFEQADSTIVLLREENNWLRIQADEAIIKSELLLQIRCQDQDTSGYPSFDEFKSAEVCSD
jgi:hypothetical protein